MAEKKRFDLAEVLRNVPDMDTTPPGHEQIKYIDASLIRSDPNNFYSVDGIDDLAANIEVVGLQQPIRVRRDNERPGRYIIVSGHRRMAALKKLGKAEAPCIVETDTVSESMRELRLIYANMDTRKMSPADIDRQAERVTELLYKLKAEGYEFPGRMRDHVAQACNVSKSKLARLKVIREGLIPEYKGSWDLGGIDESAAYALARIPPDIQRRIYKSTKKVPRTADLDVVLRKCADGCDWMPTFSCPGGGACTHGDTFLRKSLSGGYPVCDGHTCCLDCYYGADSNYGTCDRMCSKAKDARKTRREKQDRQAAEKARRETAAAQAATVENARRVLRAAEAAGLADDVPIPWEYYGFSVTVGGLRKYAAGDFGEDQTTWYGAKFRPCDLAKAMEAVKVLKCSADYLLGLTDDLSPTAEAGWRTDSCYPDGEWIVCRFAPAMAPKMMFARDGRLYFSQGPDSVPAERSPERWCRLPKENENDETE